MADDVPKNTELVLALQIDEGETDPESRANYDYVFSELARSTGGLHETVLSSLGVESGMKKLSAFLRGSYRLSYATLPGLKNRKLEVKVARPGVKVKVGPSQAPGY